MCRQPSDFVERNSKQFELLFVRKIWNSEHPTRKTGFPFREHLLLVIWALLCVNGIRWVQNLPLFESSAMQKTETTRQTEAQIKITRPY